MIELSIVRVVVECVIVEDIVIFEYYIEVEYVVFVREEVGLVLKLFGDFYFEIVCIVD